MVETKRKGGGPRTNLVVAEVNHGLRVREAALELVSPLLVDIPQRAAHLLQRLVTSEKRKAHKKTAVL